MLKKILTGSGLALALFLLIVFFFGGQNNISLHSPVFSKQQIAQEPVTAPVVAKNFTDTISDKLAAQVLHDNPDGPQVGSDGNMNLDISDPKKFVSEALAAETSQFNPDDFIETIDEARVIVLPQNSNEGSRAYVQGLMDILKKELKTPIPDTEDKAATVFPQLAQERANALSDMYSLKATPDVADLHRDILTIVGTQGNVFAALGNYQTDALRAVLAAKFQSVIQLNLEDIKKRMNEYAATHGITG